MEKVEIQNRKGQKIVVLVEGKDNSKGLAFIMHGLGGFKDQDHIKTFADAFREGGYVAVRFDTTNTYGESDGDYADATVTNYYADLEDVIEWAKSQEWYQEPFVLVGHSLGGICTSLYAEKHPEKVKALAPISTVVSGKLSAVSHEEEMKSWEETGWKIKESATQPGLMKKLKWSHMIDRLKYDLMPEVEKLTMPVLIIVGEKDDSTPAEHQKILFDKLPGKKEMHIIKEAPHTFRTEQHLAEIKKIFKDWISNL